MSIRIGVLVELRLVFIRFGMTVGKTDKHIEKKPMSRRRLKTKITIDTHPVNMLRMRFPLITVGMI